MDLKDYARSINPKDPYLIPGQKYKVWREGKYLGIAEWVDDPRIGPSFQQREGDEVEVCIADRWEPVNEA